MGQVRSHVLETHVGINVSSVIKHYPAQSSANQRRGNAQREAQLEFKITSCLPPTGTEIFSPQFGFSADRPKLLVAAGTIQAEATECAAPPEKKLSLMGMWLPPNAFPSQPQAVGPYHDESLVSDL